MSHALSLVSGNRVPAVDPSRPITLLRDVFRRLLAAPRKLLSFLSPSRANAGEFAPHTLAYIHGICRHEPGYSQGWWEALRPHLTAATRAVLENNRPEVLWSDLVSPPALGVAAAPRSAAPLSTPHERELADALRASLQRRATPPPGAQAALLGIPGLDCIDDFVKYLARNAVRQAVQQRFLDVVVPLLEQGTAVEVVSHSWGTVVAYEALRTIDGRNFSGHVRNLFTVGSALAIDLVQPLVRPRDGLRPRNVRRWVNLDAAGDFVGGPLTGEFAVDLDKVDLPPFGCAEVSDWVSPACAHSSYFTAGNTAVNRDIFAAEIERP